MLVGDDEPTLQALGDILAMCHMKCDMRLLKTALPGALLQHSEDYDFIILDYMEFSPKGLDLLLSIRESTNNKPIIIITNNRSYEKDAELIHNHGVHLLRKPVDISILLQVIETALKTSSN